MKRIAFYLVALLALSGCVSAPNTPSLVLTTAKTPSDYAQCVYPKWQKQQLATKLSEQRNRATIVSESPIAADQILEVHKAPAGSEVSVYLRATLVSALGTTPLESAARECL